MLSFTVALLDFDRDNPTSYCIHYYSAFRLSVTVKQSTHSSLLSFQFFVCKRRVCITSLRSRNMRRTKEVLVPANGLYNSAHRRFYTHETLKPWVSKLGITLAV